MAIIEALRDGIDRIEIAQGECMKDGAVLPQYRYKYQLLELEGIALKKHFEFMKGLLGKEK
jgi:hypothetical protein